MKNFSNINIIIILVITASIALFLGFQIGKGRAAIVYLPQKNINDSLKVLNGYYTMNIVGEILSIENNKLTLQNQGEKATFSLDKNVIVTAPYIPDIKLSVSPTIIVNKQKLKSRIASIKELSIGKFIAATLSVSQKGMSIKSIYIISNSVVSNDKK